MSHHPARRPSRSSGSTTRSPRRRCRTRAASRKTFVLFCFVSLAFGCRLGTDSVGSRFPVGFPTALLPVPTCGFALLSVRGDVLGRAPARHRVGVARVGFEQAYPEHRGNPRFQRLRVDAQPVANHLGQRSVAALVGEKNQRGFVSVYLLQDAPVGPVRARAALDDELGHLRVVHGVHAVLEVVQKLTSSPSSGGFSGAFMESTSSTAQRISKSPYSSRGLGMTLST